MEKEQGVTLVNGNKMPIFGLGTWKSKPGEVKAAVVAALQMGYRHIDCAMCYQNEPEVGEALAECFSSGLVKREDVFITSKLWNTFHSKDKVIPALKKTLEDLRLDYVDMYLIHWPMGYKEDMGTLFPKDGEEWLFSDVDYVDTWKGLEEAVALGLTKAIGVSNFNKDQMERIAAIATIPIANLQIECHPHVPQKKMLEYCRGKNIAVTAYSPLGSPDRPWAKPGDYILMEDPVIAGIAKAHDKTPAQVLVRFQIQRGVIVIPKSVTKSRIESNSKVFDFELSKEEIATLEGLENGERICGLPWMTHHPHFPFATEF